MHLKILFDKIHPMTEQDKSYPEFESMSPSDLNAELIHMFYQIPKETNEDRDKIYKGIEEDVRELEEKGFTDPLDYLNMRGTNQKRWEEEATQASQSEPFLSWNHRLKHLLTRAPTTQSFRDFITQEMSRQFIWKSRDFQQWKIFYISPIGEGGLFNPEEAKEFDQKGYSNLFWQYRLRLGISTMAANNDMKIAAQSDFGYEELMGRWRQEFIDLWGQEP